MELVAQLEFSYSRKCPGEDRRNEHFGIHSHPELHNCFGNSFPMNTAYAHRSDKQVEHTVGLSNRILDVPADNL
jgi:hypothetical protein